jgi:RNA polymerase sigma factor (sigma-70 family)
MSTMQYLREANDGHEGSIEETLLEYDSYIVAQARMCISQSAGSVNAVLLDLDADELAQMVRIKLWHVLEEREVVYLKPYIRRIINSEFIDMLRRRKPTQPLPEDADGEISMGKVIAAASEGIADPAEVIEEREEAECCMEEIVDAVLELPRRQQHVMICTMQDRVDDPVPLIHALQSRQRDIRTWQWPQQKQDKQLLMASLSYARRNLAASLASVS